MQDLTIEEIASRFSGLKEASDATGIPRGTIWSRMRKAGLTFDGPEIRMMKGVEGEKTVTGEHYTQGESESEKTISSFSEDIRTVEDAIDYGGVDLNIWALDKSVVNKWGSNWQVKVWLKRRYPKDVTDAFDNLLESLVEISPVVSPVPYSPGDDPHMAELSLCDVHFGKYGWAREVGSNTDLITTEASFEKATDELLAKLAHFSIDKILIPVGNDFFHFDSLEKHKVPMTTNGTAQDVDGRWAKVYETGVRAMVRAIDRASRVSKVKVIWVPGNHDYHVSWYMVRELAAWYRNNANVSFDLDDIKSRKYESYGVNLLGFTHGDEEKHHELPLIMASEEPMKWATSKFREVHLGHFHKKKEMKLVTADEYNSVRVRILPSLSGTDAWHYRKGYVGGPRAAEIFLYSRDNGYTGHFSSNV